MVLGVHAPRMALTIPRRTAALFGFAAIAVWLALYLTAVALYPGYSATENYLSDLGHPDAPGNWAFNAGDILGGILFLPFSYGLARALGGRLALIGGALLIAANGFLVLVGVFPEESPYALHTIASAGFFFLLGIGAAVLAVPLHRSKAFGPVVALLGGVVFAACIAYPITGLQPIIEHVAVFSGIVWAGLAAVLLYASKG